MRYCVFCHRLSAGKPNFCPFCSRTYEARICKSCKRVNPKQNLYCYACGSQDLSEPAGDIPWWILLLKISFWSFLLFLLIGFISNLGSFVPMFIPIVLMLIPFYYLMPEECKKITSFIFKLMKQMIFGVKKEN